MVISIVFAFHRRWLIFRDCMRLSASRQLVSVELHT